MVYEREFEEVYKGTLKEVEKKIFYTTITLTRNKGKIMSLVLPGSHGRRRETSRQNTTVTPVWMVPHQGWLPFHSILIIPSD